MVSALAVAPVGKVKIVDGAFCQCRIDDAAADNQLNGTALCAAADSLVGKCRPFCDAFHLHGDDLYPVAVDVHGGHCLSVLFQLYCRIRIAWRIGCNLYLDTVVQTYGTLILVIVAYGKDRSRTLRVNHHQRRVDDVAFNAAGVVRALDPD